MDIHVYRRKYTAHDTSTRDVGVLIPRELFEGLSPFSFVESCIE